MSRIGGIGQIGAGQLQIIHRLTDIGSAIDQSNLRLATMKKINSAKDDPAGLVRAQTLESSLSAIDAAASSVSQAQALLDTADAAASSIVTQLSAAKSLALQVAGGTLNASEKAAKQNQLDEILNSIDRLSRTEYNGTRLLDGTSGFRVTGVDAAKISNVEILSKSADDNVSVSINVTTQAQQAAKSYAGGALAADTTLEITGPSGTTSITLANGATTQDITDAFNGVSYLTGITATRVDGTTVDFDTADYGSAATIAITATQGSFATTGTGVGVDAVATINGQSVTAEGTRFNFANSDVNLQVDVKPAASGAISAFTVSGTGLNFQVSTDANDPARIGLADLSTASLGGSTGKLYSLRSGQPNSLLTGDPLTTMQIIDEAISDAQSAQTRIGGFSKYTLNSAASMLNSQQENVSADYQSVMDVDVASETALAAKYQLLQGAAYQALQVSLLSNSQVLDLLNATAIRW